MASCTMEVSALMLNFCSSYEADCRPRLHDWHEAWFYEMAGIRKVCFQTTRTSRVLACAIMVKCIRLMMRMMRVRLHLTQASMLFHSVHSAIKSLLFQY
jgi:hypothetical protein